MRHNETPGMLEGWKAGIMGDGWRCFKSFEIKVDGFNAKVHHTCIIKNERRSL
jgi:hypothetical protein